jgi:hypothetical protein
VFDREGVGTGVTGEFDDVALPGPDTELASGDRILFAGVAGVEALQRRFLLDPTPIVFVRTGVEPARSWIFRRLAAGRAGTSAARRDAKL